MLIWALTFLQLAVAEDPLTYEAALSQALAANSNYSNQSSVGTKPRRGCCPAGRSSTRTSILRTIVGTGTSRSFKVPFDMKNRYDGCDVHWWNDIHRYVIRFIFIVYEKLR